MEDLRVHKHTVAADVIFPGGAVRSMAFFLAEAAPDHTGPERPLDLLNGAEDFLPAFDEEAAATTILHRHGITVVRVDRAHDAGDPPGAPPVEYEVDVHLSDGTAQRGLLGVVRPPGQSRLVDALNEPPAFFRLLQGAQVAYVNKRHVARVTVRPR